MHQDHMVILISIAMWSVQTNDVAENCYSETALLLCTLHLLLCDIDMQIENICMHVQKSSRTDVTVVDHQLIINDMTIHMSVTITDILHHAKSNVLAPTAESPATLTTWSSRRTRFIRNIKCPNISLNMATRLKCTLSIALPTLLLVWGFSRITRAQVTMHGDV
jgi:hypothetical protein